MNSELCAACRSITLPKLITGFMHPLDRDQISKSRNSCQLCALLLDIYAKQTCINYSETASDGCDKLHRHRLKWKVMGLGPGLRAGMFRLDSQHFGPYIRVCAPEESTLFQQGIITQREIQPADSPRNLRLLRNWLDECRMHHPKCRRGSYSGQTFDDASCSTALPFRVIDVGSTDNPETHPRLVTTHHNIAGRYLTLSHCWGKVQPTKTTKATLDSWHVALPWAELSTTFRDAIRLTRDLGERFLWIDSLCIVQDDPVDLDTQIQLMGVIFEGSYCTIAATDAKGTDGSLLTDQGLFLSGPWSTKHARLLLRKGPSPLPTENQNNNNDPDNVKIARKWLEHEEVEKVSVPNEFHEVILDESPVHAGTPTLQLQQKAWHSRGWVFQERELTRRCIFFAQDHLMWRCSRYWETEQTGVPERRMTYTTGDLDTPNTFGGYNAHDLDYNLRLLWEGCVQNYSATRLTYISDKHKALRGLEERLTTRFDVIFRFGIMDFGHKETVLRQLLWMPASAQGKSLKGDPHFSCPSWSWMIIDGPVVWSLYEYLAHPELLASIQFGKQSLKDGTQELHISGVGATISVGPMVGEIECFADGAERWTKEPHGQIATDPRTNWVLSTNGSDERIGWVVIDTAASDGQPGEVIAAPLLQYFRMDDEDDSMCVDFLALIKQTDSVAGADYGDAPEQYSRVGRGRVIKNAFVWLQTCQHLNFTVL
ncbi:heterokaryon incompatibility protein-domain-containing protein [Podospora didyma]|uniref:Heterokaryon incompatibility protein-domain-containing protein n=1 Tax=Podospora didyma TaxID=330526 RepID=A0AAE0NPH1_9PEZI|nr:heterokaryon incompatibility protein-domain-containing protein [Podospora didyma]